MFCYLYINLNFMYQILLLLIYKENININVPMYKKLFSFIIYPQATIIKNIFKTT